MHYLPNMSGKPTDRLFLIDGYALIYRAFFAMINRPLRTNRGENTSAVWGVANFLHRLLERQNPTHIIWVHDAGTSFRTDKYPEYKATREKLDEDMQQDFDRSVERIEELLEAFKIPLVAVEGYEADDVIGTLATLASAEGFQSVIVSGDKDFYQLISEDTVLLNPGRGGPSPVDEVLVDVTNASERLGVVPERVVDYLALVGDSSDNVPGVKGIGDKTARALIEQYGDLEAILTNASAVKGKRAREGLLEYAAEARLSRELVTIQRDVPVMLDLEKCRLRSPDSASLSRLYIEMEFRSLAEKVARVSTEDAPIVEAVPISCEPTLVEDPADIQDIVARIKDADVVALITKGRSHSYRGGGVAGLALAVESGTAWYFPLGHDSCEGELLAGDLPANLPGLHSDVMRPLLELLQDTTDRLVGHDVKRDWLLLRGTGVELAGVKLDTMLASFVLDPGRRSHALGEMAQEHLNVRLTPVTELTGKGKSERPFSEVAPEEAASLCCAEAQAIVQLFSFFNNRLDETAARTLIDELEMPLVEVLVDMEWRGISIDSPGLLGLSNRFSRELAKLQDSIYEAAGTEFNINSTPQLRHILFEKLQLPVIKKTKTGASTDAEVLVQLAGMGFDVPTLLLEYRELTKLKSTYVDVLPASVNAQTGRIHTTFNQTGAATGRLSSSDPNLQNIPVRTPRGELIRQCFIPASGHQFIVADYSQVELRVLAHMSHDPAFIEAFQRGGDIHVETAAIIFDVSVDQVTPEMRARAKTINFATIYGQGPFALARQLDISQEEARDFIDLYFTRFSGVRAFLDGTIESAKRSGYVETMFGRRRYIPELNNKNHNIRAFGERTAMNSPVQGSAADIIKIAMPNLSRALNDAQLETAILLQVHDELVLESPVSEVDSACQLVREKMEGAASLEVPLTVDIGVGDNWLDAKF
jgi:DNA polymerase-1